MSKHEIIDILKSQLHCSEIQLKKSCGRCQIYDTDKGNYFVKLGEPFEQSMFEGEKKNLELMEKTHTLKIPHPFLSGKTSRMSFLIVQAFDLMAHTKQSQQQLGRQLADMHLLGSPDKFGLDYDNTIGLSPQNNLWKDTWVDFFMSNRLNFQLKMIDEKKGDDELLKISEKLLNRLPEYFQDLEIRPSLLHGDLWAGNTAALAGGKPVVFDPACYYGHHEADLAMMGMFGGFTRDFFSAYHEKIPQASGFLERNKLYQLYHYLNHYLIFGRSYRESCLFIARNLS